MWRKIGKVFLCYISFYRIPFILFEISFTLSDQFREVDFQISHSIRKLDENAVYVEYNTLICANCIDEMNAFKNSA